MNEIHNLIYQERKIGDWSIPTVEFEEPARPTIYLAVIGTIVNSVVDGNRGSHRQHLWKVQIATDAMAVRGSGPWDSNDSYAVSVGFCFHTANHGGHSKFDVENYVKPIIDGLAAGLFCNPETNLQEIPRWNFDDSNFNTLLIHRLADAPNPGAEGVAICVSSKH